MPRDGQPLSAAAMEKPDAAAPGDLARDVAIPRQRYPAVFRAFRGLRGLSPSLSGGFSAAARQTDIVYGTLNTAILMTSSLAVALAGSFARSGLPRLARRCVIATLVLGAAFLVVKGVEYHEDIVKQLLPGPGFAVPERGAALFFSFYWVMTGVHASHVSAGLAAMVRLVIASRDDVSWLSGGSSEEATALYWHLVDVIWILLYPLLYLGGRAHG
jgi:cytochrome c oxidase subunit 3